MATEKQNRISLKLEGLDYIPEGFAFNQRGAWQKIKGMRTSKSKRKSLLYAAVLIPVIVAISWIFIGDKKGTDDFVVTMPAKPVEPSERLITTSKENGIAQKNLSGQSKVKVSPGKNEQHEAITSQQTEKIVAAEPSAIIIPAEEVTAVMPPTDTVVVAAAPKPKYKYRIAHINEIDDVQVQPSNLMTQKIVKKPFLASVTTVPVADEDKIVQKKKYPFSFLSNPMQ